MGKKSGRMYGAYGRVCTTCGRCLAWSKFSKDKRIANGYRSGCKECMAQYKAQRYASPEGKVAIAKLRQRNKEINKNRDVYGSEAIALYGETKWCNPHKTFHPRTKEFWSLLSSGVDGLNSVGKGKAADKKYKSNYSLKPQEVTLLRQHSNNCCYLCGKPANGDTLHVDHKKQPGKPEYKCDKEYVRGILCHECNSRIVPLFENYKNTYLLSKFTTAFVQQVFEYLRNPPAQQLLKIST